MDGLDITEQIENIIWKSIFAKKMICKIHDSEIIRSQKNITFLIEKIWQRLFYCYSHSAVAIQQENIM